MSKKALIVYGGWEGHQPKQISEVFKEILELEGYEVEISDTLDSFKDEAKLMSLDLIVPHWTMGNITGEQLNPVLKAVESGVGIAGCHGGMCDAFRNSVEWQFMTGAQWVAHPGNDSVKYDVNIVKANSSPIIEGINDFTIVSEQYYIHIDPAINVLATTTFPVNEGPHSANGSVLVPVVFTKRWGKGKVFYNAIGHNTDCFNIKEVKEIMRRGFLWASR